MMDHAVVGMVDASHWGFGALEARFGTEMVREAGLDKDRWRFGKGREPSARVSAGVEPRPSPAFARYLVIGGDRRRSPAITGDHG